VKKRWPGLGEFGFMPELLGAAFQTAGGFEECVVFHVKKYHTCRSSLRDAKAGAESAAPFFGIKRSAKGESQRAAHPLERDLPQHVLPAFEMNGAEPLLSALSRSLPSWFMFCLDRQAAGPRRRGQVPYSRMPKQLKRMPRHSSGRSDPPKESVTG